MAATIPGSGNQANHQDTQPYQVDIDQIYADFIQQIDAVRSYVNVNQTTIDKQVLDCLSGGSKDSIVNFLSPNNIYQESRCHAFFRLIGFPVCSSSYQIYNPGHPLSMLAKQQDMAYKLQIAQPSNQLIGFRNFSIAREQYPLTNAKIFASTGSIAASVLALSSGSGTSDQSANFRQLDYSKVKNAFDMVIQSQSFKVGTQGLVGEGQVPLNKYQDVNGNPATGVNLTSRSHLIFPLIVDPIIDFCVNPSTRRVGLPFVPDKTYLKISSGDTFAPRPLLEKVIRDVIGAGNTQPPLQPSQQELLNAVKNDKAFNNLTIITTVFGPNSGYSLSQQAQFSNFINIINEMMGKMAAALKAIHQAQSQYYWVPTFSTAGPEGGAGVQDVFLPNNISTTLITQKDRDILNRVIAAGMNQFDAQAAQAQGVPDVGGFAFDSFKTTFNSDTSPAFKDGNQLSVDNMVAARKNILDKAGDALRTIEIIMGEFSGLGLVDIIAIMGALYLMKPNDLLGLLDNDAQVRAQSSLGKALAGSSPSTYPDAMDALFANVQAYYATANAILKNWIDTQGSSS